MAVIKTSGGRVVATSRGRVSVGNCGTGAGGFQPGNTCAKGARHATKLPEAATARGIKLRKMDPKAKAEVDSAFDDLTSKLRPDLADKLQGVEVAVVKQETVGRRLIYDKDKVIVLIDPAHVKMLRKGPEGVYADPTLAGAIRHEFAHALEDAMEQDELQSLGVYGMKFSPSEYGATNFREKWAEFVTLITRPDFDMDSLPVEARDIARKILR